MHCLVCVLLLPVFLHDSMIVACFQHVDKERYMYTVHLLLYMAQLFERIDLATVALDSFRFIYHNMSLVVL